MLTGAEEARLRRHPVLTRLRRQKRRTQALVSVYYDTPDHALSGTGIALRLRKVGRRWVQTIKFGKNGAGGLFSRSEIERPAPGGRLALDGPDPEGMLAAIRSAVGDAALSPVFETRVQRTTERLVVADESEIELALDHGVVVSGEASLPIHEAEIELVSGSVTAVYDLAEMLFQRGPVRFAADSKAARGYALARAEPPGPIAPRNAGKMSFAPDTTVETVARDVFRDCFAQIAANLVVVADSNDIEGPHQLRVGLRRLRTAFSVFAASLGEAGIAPLSDRARTLGRVVGRLRDVDVLIDEVVAGHVTGGLDETAQTALAAALEVRREAVRGEVRKALSGCDTMAFLFDLGRLIEGRGWLEPSDYSQTGRLAAPIGGVAPALLDRRFAKVAKRGRKIRTLGHEALHELRKDLKKLRYAADILNPIYPGKKVAAYIKTLKQLQDQFGSLNDAAMAEAYLTGAAAPAPCDPAAQRAIGWVLGELSVRVRDDRPQLFDRWDRLEKVKPFWQ